MGVKVEKVEVLFIWRVVDGRQVKGGGEILFENFGRWDLWLGEL